ncbi:MAG: AtpZ/AtpI family protein [Chlorobi bacterium]|nr:AtpZ/AtpI family protein [Chlorobiota bacterium]
MSKQKPFSSEKDQKGKDHPLKFYAKYSSLGFQMLVIILIGAFGGRALDNELEWGFPVFTLVLTILAVIMSIVYGVREFFRQDKK